MKKLLNFSNFEQRYFLVVHTVEHQLLAQALIQVLGLEGWALTQGSTY